MEIRPAPFLVRHSIVLAALLMTPITALAEADCTDETQPHLPRVTKTWDGIPLTEAMTLEMKGEPFTLYAGHLRFWPTKHRKPFKTNRSVNSISAVYWMPSLRYPERNPLNVPAFRPCEAGRPAPTSNEYQVRTDLVLPFSGDRGGFRSPMENYENTIKNRGGENQFEYENLYGLTRYSIGKRSSKYPSYFFVEDNILELTLDCTSPVVGLPNPDCGGYAYYLKDSLSFRFYFPYDRLFEWRTILSATRSLYVEWHENGLAAQEK